MRQVDEGVARYKAGDYGGALERFRTAYRTYPSPKILFDIGTALAQLGRDAEAADALDEFVAEAGADPALAPQRRDAARSLSRIEKKLARLTIRVAPADAQVRVDAADRKIGRRPIHLTPGHHLVEANAPGRQSARAEIDLSPEEQRELSLPLALAPRPAPADVPGTLALGSVTRKRTPPPRARHRLLVWIAASAAVACGAGGFLLGRQADRAYEEYQTTDSLDRYHLLRERIQRDSLGANVLFATASAAALGATVLYAIEF
jgi:hypothetical protein